MVAAVYGTEFAAVYRRDRSFENPAAASVLGR
jgi:hypothetical protein